MRHFPPSFAIETGCQRVYAFIATAKVTVIAKGGTRSNCVKESPGGKEDSSKIQFEGAFLASPHV